MLSNNANLLYGILITAGPQSATTLAKRTALSQPVVSRALNEISRETGRLVNHRQGRSVIYGITKQIRSLPTEIPIQQVAPSAELGSAALFGTLTALEGGGYLFVDRNGQREFFEGLPWFLQDMRPQGYIGRAFCQAHSEDLGLSDSLTEWSDDDIIYALSAFGEDSPGNLIVGNAALRRYLSTNPDVNVESSFVVEYFDRMADSAVQGGVPGSSAAGEHPKFLAHYRNGNELRNVIVKFSPLLDGSPAATRWKDLLIAEHVASLTLGSAGIGVPESRIVISERRCYLESARYDRIGLKGRIATVSFEAIDNAFIGQRRNWSLSSTALLNQGLISKDCDEQIRLIESFGRLIANTDMHFGNLSFYWDRQEGMVRLRLAPIYDMLPMLYAPEKSEVVDRTFNLPSTSIGGTVELAYQFWTDLAAHDNVSDAFRKIATTNAAKIDSYRTSSRSLQSVV